MKEVKKVDVIRPRPLRAITGPSGTLRRIIRNRSYFLQRGYDFDIFTHDNIYHGTNLPPLKNIVNKSNSLRFKIASKLRTSARKSYVLGKFYIKKEYNHVQKLVNYYIDLQREPDIVAFHSVFECYQFLKKNKRDCKVICFFHSQGIPFSMTLNSFPKLEGTKFFNELYRMEQYVGENVSKLIFITHVGQSNFLKYHPNISKEKTAVILNGIEDFKNSEKKNIDTLEKWTSAKHHLCCVGSITARKGQQIIVEALSKMDTSILKDVFISFIGDGSERMTLEQFAHARGLLKHVKFFGSVDNTEVYKYLHKATIFILMSNNEGLPISIIEAMREGLPIISTRISGIPELVKNGKNGLLIDPNVQQLTNVLNHINDYDWVQMGKCSRKRFESEFTFERMSKEYCDVLDNL